MKDLSIIFFTNCLCKQRKMNLQNKYVKYKILHKNSLITVAKICEKVLRLNMTSTTKVKEEKKYA